MSWDELSGFYAKYTKKQQNNPEILMFETLNEKKWPKLALMQKSTIFSVQLNL